MDSSNPYAGNQDSMQPGPGQEENTYLASGNHGVNEIWSNKHCKWFLSDAEFDGQLLPDTILLAGLTSQEEREACRAL